MELVGCSRPLAACGQEVNDLFESPGPGFPYWVDWHASHSATLATLLSLLTQERDRGRGFQHFHCDTHSHAAKLRVGKQDRVTSSSLLSWPRVHSAQEQDHDGHAARSVDAHPASLPSALSSESEPHRTATEMLLYSFCLCWWDRNSPGLKAGAWAWSLVYICIRLVTGS